VKGLSLFSVFRKWGLSPLFFLAITATAATPDFADDFEAHTPGTIPGTPWKEETYNSGALISVDRQRAFSGKQALHILDPRAANYRRGYVAIHLAGPLPQLQSAFYGRAMVWLDAAPVSLPGAPAVQWTLLQGEGRSADDRYNAIYRLGLEQRAGLGLMSNYETTPPVMTDCKQQSPLALPVRRWACVEWHFAVATHELEFWLDGRRIAHVRERASKADACRGNDLGGVWRAPPRFDSFYLGFERYADSANDQNLWIDDVALSKQRVGCPEQPGK
jgi:hypothetical protein